MQGQRPFTFDQSFDVASIKAAEEKKAALVFTEQDITHAREQGYGQGFVAGKEAALQEIQQQQISILVGIQKSVEAVGAAVWKVGVAQKQIALDVAMAIVRRIIPEYLRKNGTQEIMAAVESTVSEMINEPRLVLRVNETQFDFINREVGEMVKRIGYGGKMIILSDNNLGEQDCKLEWADGGMERSSESTMNEIEKQVRRHGPLAQARTHQQTQEQHYEHQNTHTTDTTA